MRRSRGLPTLTAVYKATMLRSICVLVSVLHLGIASDAAPSTQPVVISRGDLAGTYQAFPDACRLQDGRIACVFYAGYGHVSLQHAQWPRGGRICVVYSSDEGCTWTRPAVLLDSVEDDRDPHIAQMSDGTLVCSFFTRWVRDGKADFDTCIVTSSDNGKSWGVEPRILAKRWACSAPARELADGTQILGVYAMEGAKAPFGAVLRSTDKGKTWSQPISIDRDSGIDLPAETDVIPLKDGMLFAALRGGQANMHFATSGDQGITWSRVADIGFKGHCPHLTRLSTGEILLTHRLPGTALHISRDECRTWQGPFEVDRKIGAYAATVELKDHTVLVVYYEEGQTSAIRARRFGVRATGIEMLPLE